MEFIQSRDGSSERVHEMLLEYLKRLKWDSKDAAEERKIWQTIADRKEDDKARNASIPGYRKILPRFPQYYYTITQARPADEYFFAYTPAGITIVRVPQSQLGHGVLGVAYIGSNLIKIADHLQGLDFEEVKKHEINHILYPFLTEWQIRQKTKSELPFAARYN